MSYLNAVRLHFAGTFRANPGTVNNDTRHFNAATFKERYQTVEDPPNLNGWWNPKGANAFRLSECRVTNVCYADGTSTFSEAEDPILRMTVREAQDRSAAKIVDLDPEQQFVSEIWGLQINVSDGARTAIKGEFLPVAFSDMWWVRRTPWFQSLIAPVQIDEGIDSRFLRELSELTTEDALSVKFVVDQHSSSSDRNRGRGFTYGRVYGTIGPYLAGEPRHFVAGRYLRPVSSNPRNAANSVYCISAMVDRERPKLRLDLGNALLISADNALNVGALYGGYIDEKRGFTLLGNATSNPTVAPAVAVARDAQILYRPDVDYEADGLAWYHRTAGIVDLPGNSALTDEQMSAIASRPLAVAQQLSSTEFRIVASENRHGLFVRPDTFTFRINPGDDQEVTLFATKFGEPTANLQIRAVEELAHIGLGSIGDEDEIHLPRQPRKGIPQDAISYPLLVTTNTRGVAKVTVKTKNPGSPRFLDGQMYGVAFYPADVLVQENNNLVLDPEYRHNPLHALSILLWSGMPEVKEPTWYGHILPILEVYANLYPVMKGMMRLDDYDSVVSNQKLIAMAMSLDEAHPNYMPVTRDLSRAKKQLILHWLELKDNATGLPPKGDPPDTRPVKETSALAGAAVRGGKGAQFTNG